MRESEAVGYGPILITGISGITGRALAKALHARGARVLGLTSSHQSQERLASAGIASVVGDLRDEESLVTAMRQARAVYHICPQMQDDELAIGKNIIKAARNANIERVVYHSVARSHLDEVVFHLEKTRVEIALLHSGLQYTIVQPTNYMQNLRFAWGEIEARGVFAFPYSAAKSMTWVDVNDVAEASAGILLEQGHELATYELCGTPTPLTRVEMASLISSALGRPVRAEVADLRSYLSTGRWSLRPQSERDKIETMYTHYDRYGFAAGNIRVLQMLLGRQPTDYRSFVHRFIGQQGLNSP